MTNSVDLEFQIKNSGKHPDRSKNYALRRNTQRDIYLDSIYFRGKFRVDRRPKTFPE